MHLIIQGIDIENHDLRSLAKLSGADQIQRITGQAFRLLNVILVLLVVITVILNRILVSVGIQRDDRLDVD